MSIRHSFWYGTVFVWAIPTRTILSVLFEVPLWLMISPTVHHCLQRCIHDFHVRHDDFGAIIDALGDLLFWIHGMWPLASLTNFKQCYLFILLYRALLSPYFCPPQIFDDMFCWLLFSSREVSDGHRLALAICTGIKWQWFLSPFLLTIAVWGSWLFCPRCRELVVWWWRTRPFILRPFKRPVTSLMSFLVLSRISDRLVTEMRWNQWKF